MKHIKENVRQIGKEYRALWRTDNTNLITETFTVSYEIHLDKLNEIVNSLKSIKDSLKLKVEGLTEIEQFDLQRAEEELLEKETLLNDINNQLKEK